MTTPIRPGPGRLSALCSALLVAPFATVGGPALAQTIDSEGSATVGLYGISGSSADRAQFGQYNGLRAVGSAYGVLGFDYYRHDAGADSTVQVQGRNLLLETRELGLRWKKQGDWKFAADYSEGVHRDPNTLHTGLVGAGSTHPEVVPIPGLPGGVGGSGADVELKLKRTALGLAYWTALTPALELDVSLKSENKEGARLSGIGFGCPSAVAPGCRSGSGIATGSAVLALPEPVDANHTQIEGRLSYADGNFRVSGGYYGSIYRNAYGSLNPSVPGSLYNPVGGLYPLSTGLQAILNQPVALAPDNQAHQLDLLGSYAFTPTTQLNFKLGYAQATQHQDFAAAGLSGAPPGIAELGGKIVTQLAQIGLHARPLPKLSLQAELRYEDRDDRTPIAPYTLAGAAVSSNAALPNRRLRSKLQGAYQIASDWRGTVGADYETIDRGAYTASASAGGVSALRQRTDETSLHAELRHTLTETLSGALALSSSRRDGSNWLRPNSGTGVSEVADPNSLGSGLPATAIYSPTLADRRRDKLKLFADWRPSESLALQFSAEDGQDRYPVPGAYGLRDTRMGLFSLDGSYALSESWNLSGYISAGRQTLNQARAGGYILAFRNTSTDFGLGVTGKPMSKLEVGGNLGFIDERDVYAQTADVYASPENLALLAATGGLPDTRYRQTALNLYGQYALTKESSLRLDFIYRNTRLDDWTWGYNNVPYTYSDGSTVTQSPNQHVALLGLSYSFKWR